MTEGKREIAIFGDARMPFLVCDATDDWPKMPELEEIARWEAEWREKLAAEARAHAA